MKTLHRYLLRQIIVTLLLTAAVFTAVLLFGNVLREILPLLISRRVTVGIVAQAFGLLIPFVWVFALPMGMLTATLLVFGRFSADQELTAARASGISLISLVIPILILSLFLCGISALVNLEIAPRSRVAYNQLRFDLRTVLLNSQLLPEGRPIKEFPGKIVYVGKNRRGVLEDIRIFTLKNETNLEAKIEAPRGLINIDKTNRTLTVHLYDGQLVWVSGAVPAPFKEMIIPFDMESAQRVAKRPNIKDMTLSELRAELKDLETRAGLPLEIEQSVTEQGRRQREDMKKQRKDMMEPIRIQIHQKLAFSFACFGFTLIGIPLGIRAHRRETNVGVAITLFLVGIYYSFIIIGSALSSRPEFAPHLMMWLPNFVFQVTGAVLLWRANRGI